MTEKQLQATTDWALLIGVNNYSEAQGVLNGCVNDANLMKKYLESTIESGLDIALLTASSSTVIGAPSLEDKDAWPTCKNVTNHLDRIAGASKPGDRVFVFYAGHGAKTSSLMYSLILLSDDGRGEKYLRLTGLYKRLEVMVANGIIVTLILDCCFSGGFIRGDDQRHVKIRSMDYDSSIPIYSIPEPTIPSWQNDNDTRDANMEAGWLNHAIGFMLLAACSPEEQAYEVRLNGQYQGVFTHYLVHALNSLIENGINLTHHAVHEQLSTSIHAHWPRQTPMRYGKQNDILFGGSLLAPTSRSVPIYRTKEGDIRLRAGEIHGIAKGDEFYVYPVDSTGPGHVRSGEVKSANMRTSTIRSIDSDLVPIEGRSTGHILGNWRAEPMSSVSPKVLLVGVPPEFVSGARSTSQAKPRHLRLVDSVSTNGSQMEDSCTYKVTINEEDEFEIVDAALARVPLVPLIQRSSNGASDMVMSILQHIADYKYFEGLENRLPDHRFQASLRIDSEPSPGNFNRIDVKHDEDIVFSFTNTSDEAKYVGVFNLRPSWELNAITDTGFITLPAREGEKDGELEIALRAKIPEDLQTKGYSSCEEQIKLLITNKSTYFLWSLPSIFQVVEDSYERYRGQGGNLDDSISNFLGGYRGDDKGCWLAKTYFLRTSI